MKKALHIRVLLGCVVALSAMVWVTPALAAHRAASGQTGYLEICKYSDPMAPVTGTFTFDVNGGTAAGGQTVTVPVGTCTQPFQVAAGNAQVTEELAPWFGVTSITMAPGEGPLLESTNLAAGTAVINVVPGGIATTATVNYTNHEVTGYLEICKNVVPGSGLTGSFDFKITDAMGAVQTVTVPVGGCSNSLLVAAGAATVQEVGSPSTYVTNISFMPASSEINADLTNATAVVNVTAGDTSQEAIVTFTNNTSVLKICKIAGDSSLLGQNFSFTANGTAVTVPAGPASTGGYCQIVPGSYRAGTLVTVTEGVNPGTMVSNISVAPSGNLSSGPDLTNRTVTVMLGPGETVVTYTNVLAPPGLLKICKIAGPGVAPGSLWSFTVSGTAGTTTVQAGSCAIVGNFPFNSTQTITETAVSGFAVSAIAASPANRLVSSDLTARTATVLIGTGVTQAMYTNTTAPAVAPGGGGGTPPPSPPPVSKPPKPPTVKVPNHATHIAMARLVERNGHWYLVIKITSASKSVHIRVVELTKHGVVIRTLQMTVRTGSKRMVLLPSAHKLGKIKVRLLSS